MRLFCAEIATLTGKVSAAKKRDEIDTELTKLRKERDGLGEAPSSIDPFADNIARFLSMFGVDATDQTKILITASRDWGKAIGVELLALFGPATLMMLLRGFGTGMETLSKPATETRRVIGHIETGESKPPPPARIHTIPGTVEEDGEMLSFITRRLEPSEGSHTKAGELYRLWVTDCGDRAVEVGSQKAFAGRFKKYFVHDPNGGRPRYLNVRPKTAQPALRMVVSNS